MYLFYQGKFLLNKKNIWFFSSICFQDFFCSESLQIIWNQSVEMLVEIHSLLTERCCCTWNRGEHQHFCQLSSFRRLEEVHKPRLNWFFKPLLILHGTNKERFVLLTCIVSVSSSNQHTSLWWMSVKSLCAALWRADSCSEAVKKSMHDSVSLRATAGRVCVHFVWLNRCIYAVWSFEFLEFRNLAF